MTYHIYYRGQFACRSLGSGVRGKMWQTHKKWGKDSTTMELSNPPSSPLPLEPAKQASTFPGRATNSRAGWAASRALIQRSQYCKHSAQTSIFPETQNWVLPEECSFYSLFSEIYFQNALKNAIGIQGYWNIWKKHPFVSHGKSQLVLTDTQKSQMKQIPQFQMGFCQIHLLYFHMMICLCSAEETLA